MMAFSRRPLHEWEARTGAPGPAGGRARTRGPLGSEPVFLWNEEPLAVALERGGAGLLKRTGVSGIQLPERGRPSRSRGSEGHTFADDLRRPEAEWWGRRDSAEGKSRKAERGGVRATEAEAAAERHASHGLASGAGRAGGHIARRQDRPSPVVSSLLDRSRFDFGR